MLDSGSSIDAISPAFVKIYKLTEEELDKPVTLQLGCVGSHSNVNKEAIATIEFGNVEITGHRFDVANISNFDVILGAPFMKKMGIILDFEHETIGIKGNIIHALQPEEQKRVINPRIPVNKTAAKYKWSHEKEQEKIK